MGRSSPMSVSGNVVKVGTEAIELSLADRIVFVVVASSTTGSQAQPHGRHRLNPVDHVLEVIFLRNSATLRVQTIVAAETGGDDLVGGWMGKEVAGQLVDREPVIRHVLVECVYNPVAPAELVSLVVVLVAVAVGITSAVEPIHRHSLPVARRLQQAVDGLFVSIG